MIEEQSFGDISGLKQSETDIRHIFNRYVRTLFDTKWAISDEMTKWSQTLINQIQEHVRQQKDLLEQEFTKKITCLNILRDQILEQAWKHEEMKDTEQITELINQCNSIKIELAMLICVDRPIQSIQLITNGSLLQQNDNQCTVQMTEEALTETTDTPSRNGSPSPTKSIVDEAPSIPNHELTISRRENLADKCPICYMIFPRTMSVSNRNVHVNEHYNDH